MGNTGSGPPSGLDLVTEAKKHYEFIQQLNFTPSIYHPNNIKRSIIRYERFWLPFARNFPNEMLIAPLDIELIWVVHMLNPVAYERDCFAIASKYSFILGFIYSISHPCLIDSENFLSRGMGMASLFAFYGWELGILLFLLKKYSGNVDYGNIPRN